MEVGDWLLAVDREDLFVACNPCDFLVVALESFTPGALGQLYFGNEAGDRLQQHSPGRACAVCTPKGCTPHTSM
ncbi:hypothetical protein WJX81_001105 [Elliptochloris bilobata]|uniref:Uncharacterized protein n=2 Tax=Elliptochloris bilobata TaxID=381761 RepID=A0AAW1QDB1_9CHLO